VTAPAALLLLHWALGARFDRRSCLRLLAYFAVALPMAAIHIAREEITPGAPFGTRILIAARATWTYVGRFLWPTDLVPMYSRWPVEENPLPSVIALVGLVAVAAVVAWRIRSIPRPAAFGLGLFVINIGPVVGLIWFPYLWYSLTADHLAYLPSAGLALILAMVLWRALDRVPRVAALSAVGVLWVVLAIATRAQTALWHDTESLWKGTLAITPESLVAHKNLGFALLAEGRVDEATSHFDEVLRLRPEDPEALLNLGLVAAGKGDLDGALVLYGRTLAQSPDNAQAWSNLGIVAAQRGDLDGAIAAYRRALEIDPQDPAPRTNLGAALVDRGEIEAGIREHEAALRLDPRFVNAHYNVGIAHLRAGRPDEAARHFAIANELAPDDVDTLYILGVALSQTSRHEEAAGWYRRLLTIAPEHADATNNLAASLLALGQTEKAFALFERAMMLAPDDPASYQIFARVLARAGRMDRAIAVLEKGLATLPSPQPDLEAQLAELRALRPG
jgi:tetratricopeptide (TPR) repeat protein